MDVERELVLMAVAAAVGAVVEMDVCGGVAVLVVLPHDKGTDSVEITAFEGEDVDFGKRICAEEERSVAFALAEGGDGGVFWLADTAVGPFVVAVHISEPHDIAVVDGGEGEFGCDVVERCVEEGDEGGIVRVVEARMEGGFDCIYKRIKGIEMVGGGAFIPEAVFQDTVLELEKHTAFAENGLLDERMVADGEADGGDGGIVPCLPIADARVVAENGDGDFAEQLVFDGLMVFWCEAWAVVGEIIAPCHGDDGDGFVQCLREHAAA